MAARTRMLSTHRVVLVGLAIGLLVALGVPRPAAASLIGELSGTVTGGGSPLPNVWVTLTPVTEEGEPRGTPKQTLTDASGSFEFPEIYVQHVKLHARAPLFSPLVDTYWPDAHTFTQAGIIAISSWPVTANLTLPVGGSVSGRVVDIETGATVPEARVSAVISASPASGSFGESDRAQGPGSFALSRLPPVPMQLRVRVPGNSPYLDIGPGESFDGVRIDGAKDSSGVVVGLRRGAEIRGTVRDDTGARVAGALVKLVGCLPNCPLIASTDDSGRYRMVGVSPGSGLGVVAWKGDRLLKQWYPGREDSSEANDITVRAGEVLDDIDFALTRGAFATVAVRGADSGEALTVAAVQLISVSDPHERYVSLRSLGGPGRMRLGPVPPGSYRVSVIPGTANPGYLPVGQEPDQQAAPGVTVELAAEDDVEILAELPPAATSGADTPGADTAGAPPSPGDHRSGSTTDSAARATGCRSAPDGAVPSDAERPGPDARWPGLARGFLAGGQVVPSW